MLKEIYEEIQREFAGYKVIFDPSGWPEFDANDVPTELPDWYYDCKTRGLDFMIDVGTNCTLCFKIRAVINDEQKTFTVKDILHYKLAI